MIATPITEQIPIRTDAHGRLRIGDTQVLLDLVIYSFRMGCTAETITDQYPSLSLDDVYLALGYYLRHQLEIDAYLIEQEEQAEIAQRQDNLNNPSKITRDMLLQRLQTKGK